MSRFKLSRGSYELYRKLTEYKDKHAQFQDDIMEEIIVTQKVRVKILTFWGPFLFFDFN